MLVLYVTAIIMVQNLGLKQLMDSETVKAVVYSLDVPTMLVLVIFAGLSFRQELTKPRYNVPKKNRWVIDATLWGFGIVSMAALLIIKYFM